MSTTDHPFCCILECDHDADFAIHAVVDGGFAGPDPYSDETHGCEAHVGVLLGHQPDLPADRAAKVQWVVVPLGKPAAPPPPSATTCR